MFDALEKYDLQDRIPYHFIHLVLSHQTSLSLPRELAVECLLKFLCLEEFLGLALALVEYVSDVFEICECGLEGGPVVMMMRRVL